MLKIIADLKIRNQYIHQNINHLYQTIHDSLNLIILQQGITTEKISSKDFQLITYGFVNKLLKLFPVCSNIY